MKLYVAGVRHHDPMGRTQLLSWFTSAQAAESVAPQFLGIENDAGLAKEIIKQRPKMFHNVASKFPGETTAVQVQLEKALGFEIDTHIEVFPDVEVLWLDSTTPDTALQPLDMFHYHDSVLEHFGFWLSLVPKGKMTSSLPKNISIGLWSGTDPIDQEKLDRDERFATAILARMGNDTSGWATVILGSDHADPNRTDSTVGILLTAGVECLVTMLDES